MNFLTEHGISSYGELESKLTAISARRDTAHTEIKRIENRAAELALVMKLGAVPLPTTESMKTELANLNAEKERLLAEYKAARTEAQEYDTVKQNVDALLTVPKEQEQQRRHELE